MNLYRLTISVDRPTFVNFLNANRTFFINTQWFFQYTDQFKASYWAATSGTSSACSRSAPATSRTG